MPLKKRVLGVDPGYERLGLAVLERCGSGEDILVFSDCVRTSPKQKHSERLLCISDSVDICIKEYKPETLVLESLFFNTNQKTMTKVAEARGVIISRAASFNVAVCEFTPLQIKLAVTGYGRSDKKQVISMVTKILNIEKDIKHDDEYDAIAIALTSVAFLSGTMVNEDIYF